VVRAASTTFAQMYTPKGGNYATWKRFASAVIRGARGRHHGFPIQSDPIAVRLLFVLPLAKADERKTRHVPRDWCRSALRGDVDNLAKGPLDAANGILWQDDRDVTTLQIEKVTAEQGEAPRVEMLVWRLERAASHRTRFEATRDERAHARLLIGFENKEIETCPQDPLALPLPR
jgi:Holliday junction resolvase RusA-like endonuclease